MLLQLTRYIAPSTVDRSATNRPQDCRLCLEKSKAAASSPTSWLLSELDSSWSTFSCACARAAVCGKRVPVLLLLWGLIGSA